jgi:phosphatidylglycerophosphate synthase
MQLHRAHGNDWDDIAPDKRNRWQLLAGRTGGYASPGNAISLVGGLLVISGLMLLVYQRHLLLAVALLCIGRLADLADGVIADWTGTKSPVGEAMDAVVDKIELILAVVVIGLLALMPVAVFITLAVHALYNVILSLTLHFRGDKMHPSRSGKFAAAVEWAAAAIFVLHYGLPMSTSLRNLTSLVAWMLFGVFVVLALVSSYQYTKELRISDEQG